MKTATDPRFSMAGWADVGSDAEELDDNARALTSQAGSDAQDEDEASVASDNEADPSGAGGATLTASALSSFAAKQRKRGVVYISRIPPGMTPAKVRHLLSNFGEVGRVFLQDGREKGRSREGGSGGGHKRKGSAHYTEGWVEFERKSVAKAAADMLNAQPIGVIGGMGAGKGKGRAGGGRELGRWRDDVWTMKYLRGFKWNMLSEQLANERASHAARLRNELSQSAFEQRDYLHKVERARVRRDKEQRRRAKEEKAGGEGEVAATPRSASRVFTFKQREAVQRDVRDQGAGKKKAAAAAAAAAGDAGAMGKVLACIF